MYSSEIPTSGSPNAKPTTASRLRSNGSHIKRPREQPADNTCNIVDDSRPKTRRVNPERLATRLDPRLVAEMDAFIVPGAKMPNFTIRKDFQERYCVDRRHIYDYFHSRGLRVAREDKHNNLLRGRLLKARSETATASGGTNKTTKRRQEEKPKKMHMRDVAKTESVKLRERQKFNHHSESSTVQSPSPSHTSWDSEEQTSSNDSPEPEFTMTDSALDNVSVSIRAYTDTEALTLPFDRFSSSCLSQNHSCGIPPTLQNMQGFASFGDEFTSFVHGENLDYYGSSFFGQDGSFAEGHLHDKITELRLVTGGTYVDHAVDGNGYIEGSYGLPRRRDGATTTHVTKNDGDVDFTKWLLTVETQEDKDDALTTRREPAPTDHRSVTQQTLSEQNMSYHRVDEGPLTAKLLASF
ncbi:hypothetical protein APHAL10511_005965 [Amanita phalloides]|nr:hypothetical protein APHAL10511_005965 [Amanita phalloides]